MKAGCGILQRRWGSGLGRGALRPGIQLVDGGWSGGRAHGGRTGLQLTGVVSGRVVGGSALQRLEPPSASWDRALQIPR